MRGVCCLEEIEIGRYVLRKERFALDRRPTTKQVYRDDFFKASSEENLVVKGCNADALFLTTNTRLEMQKERNFS